MRSLPVCALQLNFSIIFRKLRRSPKGIRASLRTVKLNFNTVHTVHEKIFHLISGINIRNPDDSLLVRVLHKPHQKCKNSLPNIVELHILNAKCHSTLRDCD